MPDMTKLNRRGFLKLGGGGGVAAAATLVPFTSANAQTEPADPSQTKLNYPNKAVTAAQKLTGDAPQPFSYHDERSPCTAVKLGSPVPGGVGPDRDIVAYKIGKAHVCTPVTTAHLV